MNIKKQIIRFTLLLTVATMLFSCSEDDKKEVERLDSVWVTVNTNADYTILAAALKKTGLDLTLSNAGSYTVFAPNNAAFEASSLPEKTVVAINALVMPADAIKIADLRVLLLNHVIGVGTRADDLLTAKYFKTFAFFRANAPVAPALPSPIITSNATAQMSMFINKVGVDVIINGNAKVTKADIDVSNGIVHMVDKVIALPTIFELLSSNPDFAPLMLVVNSADQAAVKTILTTATNLTSRTLIVPNAAAFTTATTGAGAFLVGMTPANVTKVLQYHLLGGNRVRGFFLNDFAVFTALPGVNFRTFTNAPAFRIEDLAIAPRNRVSRFVFNDIQGVNGCLHVVDKVLEPTL